MIAIVDTGCANFASIQNAFARLGKETFIGAKKNDLDKASHLILPGVGHASRAAQKLKDNDLWDYLKIESILLLNSFQYLQSKGYALPYMDYSVDDLVELGVYKLK
ncbi:hypothetical protein K2X05_13825 [bacterium]|nr:hypothetical protein [bacterium]